MASRAAASLWAQFSGIFCPAQEPWAGALKQASGACRGTGRGMLQRGARSGQMATRGGARLSRHAPSRAQETPRPLEQPPRKAARHAHASGPSGGRSQSATPAPSQVSAEAAQSSQHASERRHALAPHARGRRSHAAGCGQPAAAAAICQRQQAPPARCQAGPRQPSMHGAGAGADTAAMHAGVWGRRGRSRPGARPGSSAMSGHRSRCARRRPSRGAATCQAAMHPTAACIRKLACTSKGAAALSSSMRPCLSGRSSHTA